MLKATRNLFERTYIKVTQSLQRLYGIYFTTVLFSHQNTAKDTLTTRNQSESLCSPSMMPNLIQLKHMFFLCLISATLAITCSLSLFFLQCTLCVDIVYINSLEWGNLLCITDSVRHAVSKTGKSLCECHKISQTYFRVTQAHTHTCIVCFFSKNSCK